jgi:twitching motility two-component system response regulator PilH
MPLGACDRNLYEHSVPRQSDRVAQDLVVELYAGNQWRRVAMQDLSRTGMFLAMGTPVPAGTPVVVAMTIGCAQVASPASVTHCLVDTDARALGRTPGIGIAFREPRDEAFADAIEQMLSRARIKQPWHSHIVVADSQPRMLERLSTALDGAGFSVATASTGMEVWGACMRRTPDVVLVDRATPIIDGLQLVERFLNDDRLGSVPVIVMANEPGELEPALQRGAADVLLKPFTMLELVARAKRVAQTPKRTERVSLSGSLAELGLAPLLMLLEQQRKTGRIVASNGHAAWIDVVDGRVVDAGWSLGRAHPRQIVMSVLDWERGTFKLVASPSRLRETALAMPITHLLLESARLRDEAERPARVTSAIC